MKILLIITLFLGSLFSNELELAYQKEYAYLIAEKKALQKRLDQLSQTNEDNLNKVTNEIEKLQRKSLSFQNKIDLLNQQIVEASRGNEKQFDDSMLLDATLIQAKESLSKVEKTLNENIKKEETIKNVSIISSITSFILNVFTYRMYIIYL